MSGHVGNAVRRKAVELLAGAVGLLWSAMALAAAPTPQALESARTRALAWLYTQQRGDGSWDGAAGGMPVHATSAALDAFMNFGIAQGTAFHSGATYLLNAKPASTDALARQIITLARSHIDTAPLVARLQARAVDYSPLHSVYVGWGPYPGYLRSIQDTSLGLMAMSDASPLYVNYYGPYYYMICGFYGPGQSAIEGGWTHAGQAALGTPSTAVRSSQLLPTAYAVRALKRMVSKGVSFCSGDDESTSPYPLAQMMSRAAAMIKTRRNADGGFGEAGVSSVLETALAYQALQAVNPADLDLPDALGYLLSRQRPDGAWGAGDRGDAFQTGWALQVFPPEALVSTAGDGMPDVVKAQLGLPLATPQREPVTSNGLTVPGSDAPGAIYGARVGQVMNVGLTGMGGTGPYQFSVQTGALPPGVLLAGGALSGAPQAAGRYSLVIRQVDALGAVAQRHVQVLVEANTLATIKATGGGTAGLINDSTDTTLVVSVQGVRPTGMVTFYEGDVALGSVVLATNSPGVLATGSSFELRHRLSSGLHQLHAVYGGDANNPTATSAVASVFVADSAATTVADGVVPLPGWALLLLGGALWRGQGVWAGRRARALAAAGAEHPQS